MSGPARGRLVAVWRLLVLAGLVWLAVITVSLDLWDIPAWWQLVHP